MRTSRGRSISLTGWVLAQRRRRWMAAAVAASLVVAVLIRRGAEHQTAPPVPRRMTASVTRVIAADRLDVRLSDSPERRFELVLLGVRPAAGWEAAARDHMERLIKSGGGAVSITLDPNRGDERDARGRVAGYVFLADGRMLNESVIAQGLARASRSEAHVIARWFEQLESQARHREVGMWADAAGKGDE